MRVAKNIINSYIYTLPTCVSGLHVNCKFNKNQLCFVFSFFFWFHAFRHISGITMLGIPTEIYAYGTQYWLSIVAALTLPLSVLYIFYPVFYDLQLVSTFMYLERRYNRNVRLVAAACFLFGSTVFLPIFIYIPALALNQGAMLNSGYFRVGKFRMFFCSFSVSGISIHVVTTVTTLLCIFYTTVGGLRYFIHGVTA